MNRRLYLNHIAGLDWLIALEFGRVDDGQPSENWRGISKQFGFLHDGPEGPELGFKILDFSEFDAETPDVAEIWDGPTFDVPALGLSGVTPGEIVLATRALFGEASSINRSYFGAACDGDGQEALDLWLACLQSRDSVAHFGLGYTLYELRRYPEAYRHLRHYTEIAPCGPWNWCWLGGPVSPALPLAKGWLSTTVEAEGLSTAGQRAIGRQIAAAVEPLPWGPAATGSIAGSL